MQIIFVLVMVMMIMIVIEMLWQVLQAGQRWHAATGSAFKAVYIAMDDVNNEAFIAIQNAVQQAAVGFSAETKVVRGSRDDPLVDLQVFGWVRALFFCVLFCLRRK